MEKLTPKVKRVYDSLFADIRHQAAGVVLPSVLELRKEFGVSQLTIQRAFDALEAMGRIKRIPGKGVFVDSPTNSGEIAIVVNPILLKPGGSLYYPQMVSALAAEISSQSKGLQVRLYLGSEMSLDEYDEEKYVVSLSLDDPDFFLRMRGVITFHKLGKIQDNLIAHGIPVCSLASNIDSTTLPHVGLNRDTFYRRSLEYAKSRGLKDICFFGLGSSRDNPENDFVRVEDLIREYGLNFHPEWEVFSEKPMTEEVGFNLFNSLWECPRKPEFIISADDIACCGLLEAVNKKGLDIPRDFQLISFANKGMRFPYGREITCYEMDSSLMAEKAVEMILDQLENGIADKAKQVIIEPVLVKGETTM